MKAWTPPSRTWIDQLLETELVGCPADLAATWETCRTPPRLVPIRRYGHVESVWVVAVRGDEALYYEEVEDGFNFSRLGASGELLEHWCNDDSLVVALAKWTDGRGYWGGKMGPARPAT